MSARRHIGFIGVGAIAEALVRGLGAGGELAAGIHLTPRNAATAARLAAEFAYVTVEGDNQAVIDASEIVFLAVTPQVAEWVLGPLTFRPDQRIVSLVATFKVAKLRPLVAPAHRIFRAAPTPAVARRMGALTLCPPDPEIAGLLDGLGQLIQLDDEADIDTYWAVTGLMASYFGFLEAVSLWLSRHGQDASAAAGYVAATFHGLGSTAETGAKGGFVQLIHDHTTPGGLNEQALRELQAAGWTDRIGEVLDLIHARIEGRAGLADTLPRADVGRS